MGNALVDAAGLRGAASTAVAPVEQGGTEIVARGPVVLPHKAENALVALCGSCGATVDEALALRVRVGPKGARRWGVNSRQMSL